MECGWHEEWFRHRPQGRVLVGDLNPSAQSHLLGRSPQPHVVIQHPWEGLMGAVLDTQCVSTTPRSAHREARPQLPALALWTGAVGGTEVHLLVGNYQRSSKRS